MRERAVAGSLPHPGLELATLCGLRPVVAEPAAVTVRTVGPSLAQLADGELVDVHAVARWLGCSERTIWRSGIPFVAITPRVKRFRVADVREWLLAHVQGAA